MESGGRRTRAREIDGAMPARAGSGRERSEVVEQTGWGSRDVGGVDAADVFVVETALEPELELELELQLELEVCLTPGRPGRLRPRLRS